MRAPVVSLHGARSRRGVRRSTEFSGPCFQRLCAMEHPPWRVKTHPRGLGRVNSISMRECASKARMRAQGARAATRSISLAPLDNLRVCAGAALGNSVAKSARCLSTTRAGMIWCARNALAPQCRGQRLSQCLQHTPLSRRLRALRERWFEGASTEAWQSDDAG